MRKIVCLLAAATLTLGAAAAAAKDLKPVFVPKKDIDAADMLPPPPSRSSAAGKADLKELHIIQTERTPSEVAAARADAAERDIFIFKTVLGPNFNAKNLPLTAALSAHVEEDVLADIEPVKTIFPRIRPYNFDKTLHPVCWATNKDNAYPSGHTMTGYVMALTLASMLPEKRGAIFARADAYAHERLVCGVHHPSDVAAAKEIAYAFFGVLEDNPRFKAARDAAEKEIRRKLDLPLPAPAHAVPE
jgi:acid phosphatase (class A)